MLTLCLSFSSTIFFLPSFTSSPNFHCHGCFLDFLQCPLLSLHLDLSSLEHLLNIHLWYDFGILFSITLCTHRLAAVSYVISLGIWIISLLWLIQRFLCGFISFLCWFTFFWEEGEWVDLKLGSHCFFQAWKSWRIHLILKKHC